MSELTNAKETLVAQLAATETTLEEQAASSQALEDELARCQEELQQVTEAHKSLEVHISIMLFQNSLYFLLLLMLCS